LVAELDDRAYHVPEVYSQVQSVVADLGVSDFQIDRPDVM